MQDKIILGILQYGDMTYYEIKKAIEKSTALFYNASMGSIHPALKKLQSQACVSATDTVENGRAKKIYRITDKGRDCFALWLSEGLPLGKFKDETLVRLFFFGHLEDGERERYIADHIAQLNSKIGMLEVLKGHIEDMDVPENMESHMESHGRFQKATLDFGLDYFRFARDWYENYHDRNFNRDKS